LTDYFLFLREKASCHRKY